MKEYVVLAILPIAAPLGYNQFMAPATNHLQQQERVLGRSQTNLDHLYGETKARRTINSSRRNAIAKQKRARAETLKGLTKEAMVGDLRKQCTTLKLAASLKGISIGQRCGCLVSAADALPRKNLAYLHATTISGGKVYINGISLSRNNRRMPEADIRKALRLSKSAAGRIDTKWKSSVKRCGRMKG